MKIKKKLEWILKGCGDNLSRKNLLNVNIKHDGKNIIMTTATGSEIRRMTFEPQFIGDDEENLKMPEFEINVPKKNFDYFLRCMELNFTEQEFLIGFSYDEKTRTINHDSNLIPLRDTQEEMEYPNLEKVLEIDPDKMAGSLSIGMNANFLKGLMDGFIIDKTSAAVFQFHGTTGHIVIESGDRKLEAVHLKATLMPMSVKW